MTGAKYGIRMGRSADPRLDLPRPAAEDESGPSRGIVALREVWKGNGREDAFG